VTGRDRAGLLDLRNIAIGPRIQVKRLKPTKGIIATDSRSIETRNTAQVMDRCSTNVLRDGGSGYWRGRRVTAPVQRFWERKPDVLLTHADALVMSSAGTGQQRDRRALLARREDFA